MDLKSLLQESPSEDHRRRQELKERDDRREHERRGREREREQWDRESELRRERDAARLVVQRSPGRSFSPVTNAASSASTSHPPFGPYRSTAPERDYDAYPSTTSHGRSFSHGNSRPPPTTGPGLPPSSSRARSPPPPAPGPPLFQSPLTAHREPPMMGPGAPPEYASDHGPGSRERKQNLSQPYPHSRQALPALGKPSAPPHSYPSREPERERRAAIQARSPSWDVNREQDRRPHNHASRSPVNTFSGASHQQQAQPPSQQQQRSPPLPQTTGSPSTSATSASIHKSPALHNHHAHPGQAPMHPNSARRPPPPLTSSSLPPPPSVSPVSGRRALDSSAAPSQAPVMNSLRPYDCEPNTPNQSRHGRDAPPSSLMTSVSTASSSNGRDLDYEREQRDRDRGYVSGGLNIQQARQRDRERTLKDDIDREREFYEQQQRRMNRSASSGAGSGGQHTAASVHPSMGRDVRERDHESERMRREDMDVIRAAAANRHGHALATQGQRERDVYHSSQSYPPQPHYSQHTHQHSAPPHSHSHPAHQQQQQSMPPGPPLPQQAHQHQFPLSHPQQPPPSSQKPKGGVLKLAPPGVEVSNNPPSVSMARSDKPETLTLLPPAHAQAHAQQQQQHQHQHSSRSLGPEQSQAPAPTSPTLPLRLAPDQPYINVQPQPLGHGPQNSSPHTSKHGHSSKSYSVVPSPAGPSSNAGPSNQPLHPPAAAVQASMIAAQQAQQQHEQRQRLQQEQQYGRHPPPNSHVHHRHPHEPPPPSAASSNEMHPRAYQLRQQQEVHIHHHRPPSEPSHSHPHGNSPPGPPPPLGYPQHQSIHHPYAHSDGLMPVPMTLPLPPPSPTLEPIVSEPPVHLGTFIFPRTPFPYFFPSPSDSLLAAQQSRRASERERGRPRREPEPPLPERETHVTILVPAAYLPSTRQRDNRPRIWGGGTADRGIASGVPQDRYSYYRFTPPQPSRRVYTDDSDLVLCALHTGRISWNGIQSARSAHLDLELRLRVLRDVGHYVGGPSAVVRGDARGYASSSSEQELDLGLEKLLKSLGRTFNVREVGEEMSWLQSASWESGHDGSGIEVLGAEWVPRASAHSRGLRNRPQRLLEYAERRQQILSLSSSSSTRMLGKRSAERLEHLPVDEEEQNLTSRTLVFGRWNGADSLGFKYDPSTVRTSLFPSSISSSSERLRKRKRRKLLPNTDPADTESAVDTPSENERSRMAMVLENDKEQFLLALSSPSTTLACLEEADKENINHDVSEKPDKVKGKERKGRKYNIYVLSASTSKVKIGSTAQPANSEDKIANGNGENGLASSAPFELRTSSLKDLQLLHSDVSEDALDFQADGLAVQPSYFVNLEPLNGSASLEKKEKGWFMHVQRWRWAGRREGTTVGLL